MEQEVLFLESIRNTPYDVMILCFVEGQLAGNCRIVRQNKQKTRHRGEAMIALYRKFWNLGIGTAMFREMISLAENWGLMQLELEVIEGNDRAMALYEKIGFTVTGETPNAIRLSDGTLLKEYSMVRPI